jgi:hypothetical protein
MMFCHTLAGEAEAIPRFYFLLPAVVLLASLLRRTLHRPAILLINNVTPTGLNYTNNLVFYHTAAPTELLVPCTLCLVPCTFSSDFCPFDIIRFFCFRNGRSFRVFLSSKTCCTATAKHFIVFIDPCLVFQWKFFPHREIIHLVHI